MEVDLLGIDAVTTLTEPFHQAWAEDYRTAARTLKELREHDPEAFLAYESSTLAKMLRDQVVRSVRNRPEVVGSLGLGTFTQLINGTSGCVAARFKELNGELLPFVHRSERQDGLDRHQYDPDDLAMLSFDGMKSKVPTLVTVGYVRGFDAVEVKRILIVFHHRHKARWFFDIETGAVGVPQVLPGLQSPPRSRIVIPPSKKAKQLGTE